MGILSIQSSVAFGHVGNSAAVFPLQCLGFEVWPVNTARFSNHPGHGSRRGAVTTAAEVAGIIAGIGERGAFEDCLAVLSGYLASADVGRAALDGVAAVKAVRPDALYCCDPVMGDAEEGLYVPRDLAAFLKEEAVPRADIVVPNAFELGYLSGRAIDDAQDALEAADSVIAGGPKVVVASLNSDNAAQVLAVSGDRAWLVTMPLLPLSAKGTGDLFTALFLGHYLRTKDPRSSLEEAAAAAFAVVRMTSEVGADELLLVEARREITAPGHRFEARRIR